MGLNWFMVHQPSTYEYSSIIFRATKQRIHRRMSKKQTFISQWPGWKFKIREWIKTEGERERGRERKKT